MDPYCRSEGIAITPYSPLASGRLARRPGTETKRLAEDTYAKFKYDSTAQQDEIIIDRVAELADSHGVSMAAISLAWLLTRADAPVVGATKVSQIEDAVTATEVRLSDDDIAYLEEPYVPHRLVGVMAQNTAESATEKHVWNRN